ncbi:MAG: radical SAM protein [Candidatus Omnitrophota bacterium]
MIYKPRHCDIAISHQCMLRCKMCHIWQDTRSFHETNWLDLKAYKKFLYELRDFVEDPFFVSFGGGEPLLNHNFLGILKICQDLGFKSCLSTNAYLLDEDKVREISQAGVNTIGISLDSLDKYTHDYLRGKQGCWDRAMRAIDLIDRYCPDSIINILTIIMGINISEIIYFTKWVYNHPKLDGVIFQVIQKPFNAHVPEEWHILDEYAGLWPSDNNAANLVIDELIALRQSHHDGFKIGNPIYQLELFKLYLMNPQGFIKPRRCHLGDNAIRITWDGHVSLCDEMGDIGNIKDDTMQNIWLSEKADTVKRRIAACDKNCHFLVNCYYHGDSE